jgi:hypothetical protein
LFDFGALGGVEFIERVSGQFGIVGIHKAWRMGMGSVSGGCASSSARSFFSPV